jgi:hypothetical protein
MKTCTQQQYSKKYYPFYWISLHSRYAKLVATRYASLLPPPPPHLNAPPPPSTPPTQLPPPGRDFAPLSATAVTKITQRNKKIRQKINNKFPNSSDKQGLAFLIENILPEPDPYVFGHPGSPYGTVISLHGSGSLHQQAKN